MEKHNILSGALVGTTAMTLFSYILSHIKESNFKEPELLALLGHRLFPGTDKKLMRFAGWQIHYAVGLAFVSSYSWLWRKTRLKPTLTVGLLLGAISGIMGAFVWKLVFKIHPDPPEIEFKNYYRQLIAAHMIFGVFAALEYDPFNNTINPLQPSMK